MVLGVLLSVVVQAAPVSPRVLYEDKCLYCHSEEVTEEKHFTAAQWRREVNKMRAKAPLLITRHDAEVLTQYIVKTLKLVPQASSRPKPVSPPPVNDVLPPMPPKTDAPPKNDLPPPPEEPLRVPAETYEEPPPMPPEDEALDEEGEALMQRRCSKCHTLQRVFGKLDTLDRSLFVLHRMRLKTGSGITKADEQRIEEFLRRQFNAQ